MKKEQRRILALDLGTNTGWATNVSPSGCASASREFSGEITGWRYLAFKQWLVAELDRYKIQHVVYEETFSKGAYAARVLHGFLATLQCVHAERYPDQGTRFSLQKVHPSKIKILATGKGNASKDAMARAYGERFDMHPVDSDECDAVWLLKYSEGERSYEVLKSIKIDGKKHTAGSKINLRLF